MLCHSCFVRCCISFKVRATEIKQNRQVNYQANWNGFVTLIELSFLRQLGSGDILDFWLLMQLTANNRGISSVPDAFD